MHDTVKSLRVVKSIVRHQAHLARNVVSGRPIAPPSISSMTLDEDDIALVTALLKDRSDWLDVSVTQRFESKFAQWNGSQHAYAFMGGRVALSAAIHALGLQPGDEVIIPGYTCIVVPNAFIYAGVVPVYADIELNTYGLDVDSFVKHITPKTKAVLLQHLYGLVCRDYDAILQVARERGIRVIEDCAHATGATYKDTRVGNAGDVSFYSCETSKIFNTIQGGIAITNDDIIAERLAQYQAQAPYPAPQRIDKLLHNVFLNYYQFKHPKRWVLGDLYRLRYHHKELIATSTEEMQSIKPAHYGCRMPAPLATLGLNQLAKIDRYNSKRRQQAEVWGHWCDAQGYDRPVVIPESVPVWLRYPVLVHPDKKKDTAWALAELGVQPGVWFISHLHPRAGYVEGCPNADIAVAQCINLPTLV